MSEGTAIKIGSAGQEVLNLQKALLSMGFNPKEMDGYFGAGTEAAAKDFQQAIGLTVTGTIDKHTLDLILRITSADAADSISLSFDPKNLSRRRLISDVETRPL